MYQFWLFILLYLQLTRPQRLSMPAQMARHIRLVGKKFSCTCLWVRIYSAYMNSGHWMYYCTCGIHKNWAELDNSTWLIDKSVNCRWFFGFFCCRILVGVACLTSLCLTSLCLTWNLRIWCNSQNNQNGPAHKFEWISFVHMNHCGKQDGKETV